MGRQPFSYIAIIVPQLGGRWRALFPDLKHVQADGSTVDVAFRAAAIKATEAVELIRWSKSEPPAPRSLQDIRSGTAWSVENSIDWATPVATLVPIGKARPTLASSATS